MDKHLRDQGIKENTVRAGIFCFLSWLCLVMVETIFRVIKGPLPLPTVILMTIIIYGMLGMGTGLLLGFVTSLTLKMAKIRVAQLKVDCFYMSFCLATTIFLFWVLMLNKQFITPSSHFRYFIGNLGFIFFCLFILVVFYKGFRIIASKFHLLPSYLALTLAVNFFLAGGFYVNNTLLSNKFYTFDLLNVVVNGGIIISCILLYFLLYFGFRFLSGRITDFFQSKSMILILFAVLILCVIVWFLHRTSIPKEPSSLIDSQLKGKPNVILITMDTTRADHLSCYGYHRKTTPNLDKIAKEGLLFSNAYSTASWTLPAHASLFTGLYPSKHGAHGSMDVSIWDQGGRLDDQFITIAEVLKNEGYRTAGIIGGPYCSSSFGLAQGFDYYNEALFNIRPDLDNFMLYKIIGKFIPLRDVAFRYGYLGSRIADQINDIVFDWLNGNHKNPFFLFINYFDPHSPFAAPSPYDMLFEGKNKKIIKPPQKSREINYSVREWALIQSVLSGKQILSKKGREHLISQYDGKIAYLDFHLGKLFQKLKNLKIYDQTLIIITGDHGECFGEHDLMFHNLALYDSLIKVPLIIKYPLSMQKTETVEYPVSLIDIAPEIFTILGMSIPDHIQGIPLRKVRAQGIIAENYKQKFFLKLSPLRFDRDLRTIIKNNFKYIWSSNGKNELYNLHKDPQELHNLIDVLPKKVKELQDYLEGCLSFSNDVVSKEKPSVMDQKVKENLRALGYLE